MAGGLSTSTRRIKGQLFNQSEPRSVSDTVADRALVHRLVNIDSYFLCG